MRTSLLINSKAKKIKIVHCCGYDCVPSDLGNQMMAEHVLSLKNTNLSLRQVRLVALDVKGAASGGTIASVANIFESCSVAQLQQMGNPYYLNPRDTATDEPLRPTNDPSQFTAASDSYSPSFDSLAGCWTMPYFFQGERSTPPCCMPLQSRLLLLQLPIHLSSCFIQFFMLSTVQ